ncbi:peptide chain release factor 2 [candidate division Kazan bacterium RIFCSPHIGHO2_01_FULL_49_10]|uniref:Peptide chain release factor 2 n=1 Tax=candidate division Kazan bacterium RIFCSPLOWO2_01_FULL_48_13 TaxID=1798539 RepID=A0A1F4PQ25_UNCK3|nr:MAG: peptide chain release factor 2 [candidate division Kazan bacterium RIFCSPHIGHO2_01_FULL_49_10]OGB85152.1 MAG: peptide chain release factor 2 [candidate division Kazan bacterium RIFCSPLOWO2_01_FULL_48_13]
MAEPSFWQDQEQVRLKTKEFDKNKKLLAELDDLDSKLGSLALIMKDEKFSETDEAAVALLSEVQQKLDALEIATILNGPYDRMDAYLFLHSGTGGDDAADWTQMLRDMYLKYADRRGWKVTIIDQAEGGEAGVKSAAIKVEGDLAYGLLKAEKGVHRLVRLSPFNAQNLRQTSFALIEVIPDLGEVKDIDLPEKELRVDVFRSSGKGGQSVNTTDSAVRITHLPTKIAVSVQNERSQTQNKEMAMKILKQRVYLHYQELKDEQTRKLKGADKSGDFGHQVRSYVLHPYHQIKDHRSNFTTNQIKEVLEEGNLDELINSVILAEKSKQ